MCPLRRLASSPRAIDDGAGGIFLSFTTATSLRGQRLDRNGTAQWKVNGSNGVGLGSGELSIIGAGISGPNIVFERGTGLFARSISVSAPVRLTNVVALANHQISFTLSGGMPGRLYDVVRSASLAPFTANAWTIVGTAQAGQAWTDTTPPFPNAFYGVRERSP
jgi:hypothetical protein